MMNLLSKTSAAILVLGMAGASNLNAQNIACGNNGNKVLVCHIPPGNPANAHTICISANGVPAHVPGNNQHNDFLGDCWAGCTGMEIISVNQGKRSNGTDVPADRSIQSRMLGTPDGVNAADGFYSLGFGGEVIIKMDGGILNRPGNDLKLYETSFGQPACDDYPEHADIYVSPDMVSWAYAGRVCQDGEFDIAPFDWIQFVRIVDVSEASDFSGVVDGYDVDGIQCIPYNSPARLAGTSSEDLHGEASMSVFPNPADGRVNILFEEMENEQVQLSIVDALGRIVYNQQIFVSEEHQTSTIETNSFAPGIYSVRIDGQDVSHVQQLVIK
ncbi:MAG: T9SS type A sorting domain-containing protein [Bacteroidetes bacterium]|nr:T9SS type A sorting domain-containing protein [Bacteroidota bacterium]